MEFLGKTKYCIQLYGIISVWKLGSFMIYIKILVLFCTIVKQGQKSHKLL